MHNHYINKPIKYWRCNCKKIDHANTFVKIFLETKPHAQICPCCGSTTKHVHDYRYQTIKDLPFQLMHCYLVLHKRRYVCMCRKRFYETYHFLPRYFQRMTRLTAFIACSLYNSQSIKETARQTNVSNTTVGRILDTISYSRRKFPTTISIDEFRGNASTGKFQCILVDPIKHKILDILPDRQHNHLVSYFSSIPKDERHRVKHFVCDM